jgi:DNA-binding transcriptional ArsR family regulator
MVSKAQNKASAKSGSLKKVVGSRKMISHEQKFSLANKLPSNSRLKKSKVTSTDLMFEMAAETFRVMSAPMRLKIINCLCTEEKNVGQLLDEIDTTQPNMSQHLNTLFKAKILGRRREGVQIYYRIINERVVTLCRAVCTQIAIDSDIEHF